MEKSDSNMSRSADVDLDENLHQYSDLLRVSVEYSDLKGKSFVTIGGRIDLDVELQVERMKKFSESDQLDRQKKLKAMKTRRDRFPVPLNPWKGTLGLCMKSLDAADKDKWHVYYQSTNNFFSEQSQLKNVYVLLDLAGKQLKNIKAYNSEKLALLEAGNLNEETLHEMFNLHSSFYKGMLSLSLKIHILNFHLNKPPQLCPDTGLVDRYMAWVEGELRQYEEELETTKFIVFRLMKNKFGLRWFGLGRLPESWKGRYVKTVILHPWTNKGYKWLRNGRSYEKLKTL